MKFCSKIEILVKNRNFGQKSKFWSKIEILLKNRNFGQKSKFVSKIEIFVKFGQKLKFSSNLGKNRNRNFKHRLVRFKNIPTLFKYIRIYFKNLKKKVRTSIATKMGFNATFYL